MTSFLTPTRFSFLNKTFNFCSHIGDIGPSPVVRMQKLRLNNTKRCQQLFIHGFILSIHVKYVNYSLKWLTQMPVRNYAPFMKKYTNNKCREIYKLSPGR